MSLRDRSDRIDRSNPALLSDQVAADLRADIAAGVITGKLPSEAELAEQYGVGRVTVRRALATLVADGLIKVVHGRGTFVVS